MAGRNPELRQQLREASDSRLLELVREHCGEMDPGSARQVLRNPFATREVIEILMSERRLLSAQEFRRELVAHPQTPEVRALDLVSGLFWRDLLKLAADVKARPRIRRAADTRLAEKLPGLSAGERVALARQAGPGTISRLRNDRDPRVISALLENPRMTEGLLGPLVSSDTAHPDVLARVAADRRWGVRYGIRTILARNPRTPVPTALGILSSLKKRDLAAVASDWRLAAPVRKRANVLLGRDPV
ncbi:MAG: hypothetical protein OEM62_00535 [Acidobacteriota bacterium]|nr:hypothetical protein [Acidobacteriota bacterium]